MDEQKPPEGISFGSLLDDISDAVSFCIVPAWIFYITLSGYPDPVLQKLPLGWIAWFYALLGLGRLAYFTLDKSPIPGFFKGMPTPAAALLVMSGLIIFSQVANDGSEWTRFWGVFSFGLIIVAAILMNAYPVRYLHLGRFMSRHPWFGRGTLIVIFSVFTPYYGQASLIYMSLYALSPLVTWRIDPEIAAQETRTKPAIP